MTAKSRLHNYWEPIRAYFTQFSKDHVWSPDGHLRKCNENERTGLAQPFLEILAIHSSANWNIKLLGLAIALQTAKNKQSMDCFFLCGPTLNQADRDNWNIELSGLAVTLPTAKTNKKI